MGACQKSLLGVYPSVPSGQSLIVLHLLHTKTRWASLSNVFEVKVKVIETSMPMYAYVYLKLKSYCPRYYNLKLVKFETQL